MDMTEAELKEMLESLREMFDEYEETLENEESYEFYGTQKEHVAKGFKAFLKWMNGPGHKNPNGGAPSGRR